MREENTHRERKRGRFVPKKRECSRGRVRSGAGGHVEKGFWAVAPFFISHPRSPRLPCPAFSSSACIKSVAASASIIFYTIFLSLVPTAASHLLCLSLLTLSLSLCICRLSLFFFVSPYIFLVLLINLGVRLRVLLCRWGPS